MDGYNRLKAALLVGDEMNFLVRVEIGQAPGRRHRRKNVRLRIE
jgi:hypothetical protein